MQKTCTHCSQAFEIFPEDTAFYDDMHVSPPTHCYLCRMQRRLAYRNERFLYHRKCDKTGKQIISSFSPDKPFPVYDIDAWWSDDWDPLSYGVAFDESRPFFEQFFSLRDRVPRLALQHQKPMVNSDYCNCASKNKNCYLTFSTNHCENCYYGSWINNCKDCIDNLNIEGCELCYECTSCNQCYNLRYSRDCHNCSDSQYLRSCTGCMNCFGCSNQVNKKFMVFNEQKTKEEYEDFLKSVSLGSHVEMQAAQDRIDDLLHDQIVKEFHGTNLENSSGDYLQNCKNCFLTFDTNHGEDLRYCMCVQDEKSCMDHSYWGKNCERIYECLACGYDLFDVRFCNLCWENCSNLTYCDQCFSSKDCFGCVSLKKAKYCILNTQYTKEEYERLVPKIIERMKKDNEWSEFFPVSKSIFAYNETLACEQMPLSKEEVRAFGWQWHDDDEEIGKQYLGPSTDLPDRIDDVSDDITTKILTCTVTGKQYKIIPQELKFYREMNIPIPRKCPDERHKERLTLRNPRKLWNRECAKCQKPIATTYAPDRPEIVYCERCYLETVY